MRQTHSSANPRTEPLRQTHGNRAINDIGVMMNVKSNLVFAACDAAEPMADLQDRLLDLQEQMQSIRALADQEKRDFSDDEQKNLDKLFAAFEATESQIDRRKRIDAHAESLRAQLVPENNAPAPANGPMDPNPVSNTPRNSGGSYRTRGSRIEIPNDPATTGRWGFRNFGEFAASVRYAARGSVDPRLIANAPTTVSTESVGADGGYPVPPDFRQAIMQKVMGEEAMISRTDQMVTTGNSLTFPKDETTPWQASGGVQVYWEGEGLQLSQSKIALKDTTVRLNKLTALVPVTEELLEDAPTLDGYLNRKVPENMDFAINLALVQGNGAGRPQGVLNSPALVTVAKETSQVADTVVAENILKMWGRRYAPHTSRYIWLINQDVETQLQQMSVKVQNVAGTENVGGWPVYLQPGGLSALPYATLMGRPVISTDACNTVGDLGDILLVDMSQYLTVTKVGGARQDVSIHLWFDYDTAAFRFIFRIAGQGWWGSAISPRSGSNTRSCFVALAERA